MNLAHYTPIVAAACCALLLVAWRRSLETPREPQLPMAMEPQIQAKIAVAAEEWEIKLLELGREQSAIIDSKLVLLQQLIEQANAAAKRLEALNAHR